MIPRPLNFMVDMKDRRAPDNRTPYLQGRADQRRVDRIVAIACLIALAIYLVWRD